MLFDINILTSSSLFLHHIKLHTWRSVFRDPFRNRKSATHIYAYRYLTLIISIYRVSRRRTTYVLLSNRDSPYDDWMTMMNMTTTTTITTTTTTTTLGTDDRQHEGNNNAELERCRARALRKSAVADATRQRLPRACRSILASQVEGFSRNHSATYVFHGFSFSQPPRPSAALGGYAKSRLSSFGLRSSVTRLLSLRILCWETRGIISAIATLFLSISLIQSVLVAFCHDALSTPNMIHLGNFAVASRNLSYDSRYSFVKC